MEDAQFDTLAKALAGRRSRRATLRYGVAALVGAALSGIRPRPASAQDPKPPPGYGSIWCRGISYDISCYHPDLGRDVGFLYRAGSCSKGTFSCGLCGLHCRTYIGHCAEKFPNECGSLSGGSQPCWPHRGSWNGDPDDTGVCCVRPGGAWC